MNTLDYGRRPPSRWTRFWRAVLRWLVPDPIDFAAGRIVPKLSAEELDDIQEQLKEWERKRMKVEEAKINELVEYLEGSSNTLEHGMTMCDIPAEHYGEVVQRVAEHLFLCDGCGWWDTVDNLHNEGDEELCSDCVPGE